MEKKAESKGQENSELILWNFLKDEYKKKYGEGFD